MSKLLSSESVDESRSFIEKLSKLESGLSLVVAFEGLNAIELLLSLDGTITADYWFLDIASSLKILNYSLVLIGACCNEANSSALVIVLPFNWRSRSHLLQKSLKLKLRLLQLRQTQSPTLSVKTRFDWDWWHESLLEHWFGQSFSFKLLSHPITYLDVEPVTIDSDF